MIRIANSKDIDSILLFDPIGTEPERLRTIGESMSAGQCFVYEEQGEIVGYGILHYHFYGRGFVEVVMVAPKFRRRGIATLLMHHIEKMCKTPTIFTSTNESNVTMQNLLAKLGYRRSGIIENLDPGDSELVYCREVAR